MSTDTDYKESKSTEDEFVILKALLDARDEFVSGSLLAEQLGISRPAIHGKLEKLRDQGFTFEAVRNRGYRLTQEPEVLHPALLRYYLQ
jgi:BirA family biotin operon repressor/biotin-[acetyl-CoA-carboxylase] ligase